MSLPRRLTLTLVTATLVTLATLVLTGAGITAPLVWAVLLVLGAAGLGWLVLTTWVWPRRLIEAEQMWTAGQSPQALVEHLANTAAAQGELGYRIGLLKSYAHFAMGQREAAWNSALQAQLLRMPWWLRWRALRFLKQVSQGNDVDALKAGAALARHPEGQGRLVHLQAMLHLRQGRLERAWPLFGVALEALLDDPMALEEIMLVAMRSLIQDPQGKREVPQRLFHRALARLLFRHGDPRLPWDRVGPAHFLLAEAHYEMVLTLAASLPDAMRPPDLWTAEIASLRLLGDLEGAASAVKEGCTLFPEHFGLWLARYEIAVELRHMEEAAQALEKAGTLLDVFAEDAPERLTWRMRRAEFLFWEQGEAAQAWELLRQVPASYRGDLRPSLELQLLVAMERYEEAYQGILEALQTHPDDPDLLLLQADCLAGMGAWEALHAFLEPLGDPVKARGDYWNLRGLALGHLDQKLTARDSLERAAFMDGQNLQFVVDAGHACMDLGEWDRSAHHWRQALRLDGKNEDALIQLAETRRLLHDPEGAKRYLRECLLHHPNSGLAQEYLAELESN